MNYTPYDGWSLTGWPTTVLSRGARVVDQGTLVAKPGAGQFVRRRAVNMTGHPGHVMPELDPATNFGAKIAP